MQTGPDQLVNETNRQLVNKTKTDFEKEMVPRDFMLYFYVFTLALGTF